MVIFDPHTTHTRVHTCETRVHTRNLRIRKVLTLKLIIRRNFLGYIKVNRHALHDGVVIFNPHTTHTRVHTCVTRVHTRKLRIRKEFNLELISVVYKGLSTYSTRWSGYF